MLKQLFLDHPRSVDEHYGEHLVVAAHFGFALVAAGMACLIHAVVPGLFANTGSRAIERLHERMIAQRRTRSVAAIKPAA